MRKLEHQSEKQRQAAKRPSEVGSSIALSVHSFGGGANISTRAGRPSWRPAYAAARAVLAASLISR